MMRVELPLVILLFATMALGGCDETAGAAMVGPMVSAPIIPTASRAPAGESCAREIETYRSIVAHDLETGNVEQKVYDQIQAELARASTACSAGAGGQAHAMVAASKARHGYRA